MSGAVVFLGFVLLVVSLAANVIQYFNLKDSEEKGSYWMNERHRIAAEWSKSLDTEKAWMTSSDAWQTRAVAAETKLREQSELSYEATAHESQMT